MRAFPRIARPRLGARGRPPRRRGASRPRRAHDWLAYLGPVLGLFEGCRYEQGAVPMRGGDVLVGYTDGVVEALNTEGAEFGEGRLLEAVAASATRTAAEICERVVKCVGDWSSGAPQHDDLTLVVLKVARAARAD